MPKKELKSRSQNQQTIADKYEQARKMSFDEFLLKYGAEANAIFEKQQRQKELRESKNIQSIDYDDHSNYEYVEEWD